MCSFRISDKEIIITGKLIKEARIKDEWYEDVENPEAIIRALENAKKHIEDTKSIIYGKCRIARLVFLDEEK